MKQQQSFQDADSELDLEECAKLIYKTIQDLKERPNHQHEKDSEQISHMQQPNSNVNSLSVKFPNPAQEVVGFASQGKQHIGLRMNYPSETEDIPIKIRKIEVRFSAEKVPELVSKPECLDKLSQPDKEESQMQQGLSSPQKQIYRELCKEYSEKIAEAEGLEQHNQQLIEKTELMELEFLREKVQMKKIMAKHIKELLRLEKLALMERISPYNCWNSLTRLEEKGEQMKQTVSELRLKKSKKTKGRTKDKDNMVDDVLESYDKDKIAFGTDYAKKVEAEIVQLQKQSQRVKNQIQDEQSFARENTLLKPLDAQGVSLNHRFLVKNFLRKINEDEVYEALDFETMENIEISINKVPFAQKRRATFKSYKQQFDQTIDFVSPNLINNFAIFLYNQKYLSIARELQKGLTLHKFIQRYQLLTQSMMKYILKKVSSALLSLKMKFKDKKEDMVHLNSIFIDKCEIKIGDYGISQFLIKDIIENINISNHFYFPPEIFKNNSSEKISTWSMGILFYECIYGKKPFAYDIEDLKKYTFHQELVFPPKPQLSENAKDLIKQSLLGDPFNRLDLQAFIKHQYFNSK